MRLDELTRPDFPILDRVVNGCPLVYLDSAASSQKPRQVVEAVVRYYLTHDRGAVVVFSVEGLHPHDVAALLHAEGIAVRAGHHCAQPLMRTLGVVGTSRASFSVYSSPTKVDLLAAALERLPSAL